MKFLLGTKEYMTELFDEERMMPVTVLQAGPVYVTQVFDEESPAVQVGFGRRKAKNVAKPQHGHMKPALEAIGEDSSQYAFQWLRTMPMPSDASYTIGDRIDVSAFEVGDMITVRGTSKGKGFQGGMKRHGFHGAKERTHGTKHAEREIGSIGAMGPQRVFKGKKMPGRMGANTVSEKNLTVVAVDPDQNLLYVKGAVPGKKGGLIEIKAAS